MIRGIVLTIVVLTATGLVLSFEDAADPAPAMAKAADAFLAALGPTQRAKASLPFNSAERLDWHFVPRDRQGVPLKQMAPTSAGPLSRSAIRPLGPGFTRWTRSSTSEVLFALEAARGADPGLYYFTVFAGPRTGSVGLRYEGHTSRSTGGPDWRVVGSTPQFLGRTPPTCVTAQKGTRSLAAEEDWAARREIDDARAAPFGRRERGPPPTFSPALRRGAIRRTGGSPTQG